MDCIGEKYTLFELRKAISEIAEFLGHRPWSPISLQLFLLEYELDENDFEQLLSIIRKTLKEKPEFELSNYSISINKYLLDTNRGELADSVIYGLLKGYSKDYVPELYPEVCMEWYPELEKD